MLPDDVLSRHPASPGVPEPSKATTKRFARVARQVASQPSSARSNIWSDIPSATHQVDSTTSAPSSPSEPTSKRPVIPITAQHWSGSDASEWQASRQYTVSTYCWHVNENSIVLAIITQYTSASRRTAAAAAEGVCAGMKSSKVAGEPPMTGGWWLGAG